MDQNFAESKRFRLFCTIVLTILAVIALLPILLIVIASVTDEKALLANGYTFFPTKLSTDSYYYMVRQGSMIVRSYGITILTTVVGTAAGVLFTTMLAYPMARSSFKYRNVLSFLVFFTMLFNGGVVASYIMWSRIISIRNTIWALIVPNYLVTAFNVFLVRNYYATGIPARHRHGGAVLRPGLLERLGQRPLLHHRPDPVRHPEPAHPHHEQHPVLEEQQQRRPARHPGRRPARHLRAYGHGRHRHAARGDHLPLRAEILHQGRRARRGKRITFFLGETILWRPKNGFPQFRSLNRRNSAQRRLLVSADLTVDDISATGGHRRFVPLPRKP